MAPLRFRAWHKVTKHMVPLGGYYPTEVENSHVCDCPECEQPEAFISKDGLQFNDYEADIPCHLILMQSTGLKDKNGREIFEGDIVTGDYQGTLDTVIFANGCFCLQRAMMNYEATWWGKEIEVKGNIYENPDLLPHD